MSKAQTDPTLLQTVPKPKPTTFTTIPPIITPTTGNTTGFANGTGAPALKPDGKGHSK